MQFIAGATAPIDQIRFMYNLNPKKSIIYSFSIFISMLIVLGFFWTKALLDNNNSLEKIVNSQIKRQLIFTMRDAAHKRAMSLMRMASLSDPFDIDDEYMKFKEHAGNFISARDVLMAFYFNQEEKEAWKKVKPTIVKAERYQSQAAEYVIDNNRAKALSLLYEEIMPLQDIVSTMLTQFMDVARDELDLEIGGSLGHNKELFNLIAVMIVVVILLGGISALYFIKRTEQYESSTQKQNQRIRYLYELSSQSGITTNEQLDKMLSLGCHLLGMEIGKICQIDEEVGVNTITRVHSPQFDINPGQTIPLEYTFCRIAFGRDTPIAIDNVATSDFKDYPCYEFSHLESYIATPIVVRGKKWGTVNFSSHYPAPQPFTDTDTDLVKLIGNWVSFMLEKQVANSELNEAKLYAEKISIHKNKFFRRIGNELKTPASKIVECSDLLINSRNKLADPGVAGQLESINKTGGYLLSLINDVMDLAVLEEGKFELYFSNFTLNDAVQSIENEVNELVRRNNNTLNVNIENGEIILYTDVIRFKQMLFNIIEVINRMVKNCTIKIASTHYYINTKGWLELVITENGSGMTEEKLAGLLEPFWTKDTRLGMEMSEFDIGLIISRQICKLMDGDIKVKTLKNVGTTYTISLPVVVSEGWEKANPLAI